MPESVRFSPLQQASETDFRVPVLDHQVAEREDRDRSTRGLIA